jgi:hypothetical protein
MELLNIAMARAVWLLDIVELNPRGKTIMPELLDWLKEEYHFEKAPSSLTDLDEKSKSLSFERGQFQVREEIFVDIALKIFNDGFVAETGSSTQDSEAFLKDVMESATREFNLAFKSEMLRAKLFTSEVNVRTRKNLFGMNPKLSDFTAKIAKLLPTAPGTDFEVASFGFWPIGHPLPNTSLAQFKVERKLGSLPSENKYYSSAPLHTEDHLALLNEFEATFMT